MAPVVGMAEPSMTMGIMLMNTVKTVSEYSIGRAWPTILNTMSVKPNTPSPMVKPIAINTTAGSFNTRFSSGTGMLSFYFSVTTQAV